MGKFQNEMRRKWNELSRINQMHYIASYRTDWNEDEFFELGKRWFHNKSIIEYIEEDLDVSGGRCLEIGCGIGRMTYWLARYFDKVIGVDVSDSMIEKARYYQDKFQLSNVDYRLTDGSRFEGIENDSIDFVFSYLVFRHIPRRDIIIQNLKEVFRVLKPAHMFLIEFRLDKRLLMAGNRYKIIKNVRKFGILKIPTVEWRRFNTFDGAQIQEKKMKIILTKVGFRKFDFIHFDEGGYFVRGIK